MRGLSSSASSFAEGVGENTKGMLQLVPFLFDNSEPSSVQSSGQSSAQPLGQSSGNSSSSSSSSSSSRSGDDMPISRLLVKAHANANAMDSFLDTRNPALNSALDGVLKIGGAGAAHAASQEAYNWMRKESPTTRHDVEKFVYKAGKEGLQWGVVAGMYAGLEYGMEKARGGKHDWKNAAVGGALTGALISVSDRRISQDKMVRTALTASALATAADFLKSVHLD